MNHRLWLSSFALVGLVTVYLSGCSGGGGDPAGGNATTGGATPRLALVAWNDLGMHCLDKDFSVFSILPPYSNLHAQLVDPTSGKQVTSGVRLTYQATADTRGSINSTSVGKSNFWTWAPALFGVAPAADVGLTGNPCPGLTPAPMAWDAGAGYWKAEGLPVIPRDDALNPNYYPMVEVVARDAAGQVLASTRNVLPVSDEMSCTGCHTSGGGPDAQPAGGWVFDPDPERDWKLNILRLHDEKNFGNPQLSGLYASALAGKGYRPLGLEDTVRTETRPILCANCHPSNALGTSGFAGVKALTSAVHSWHAHVIEDATGFPLDDSRDRTACYCCHPGTLTRCLRGVMGNAVDSTGAPVIQCQSCHGNMTALGAPARQGWIDLPACGSCHCPTSSGDYAREVTVFEASGAVRPSTGVFAGQGLYKHDSGHGSLQCEACHGATHAEYATTEANDNQQSLALQGYAGKLTECTTCHATVPFTKDGGPHGMHTLGQSWVTGHGGVVERDTTHCVTCHGSNLRGTVRSRVSADRRFVVSGGALKTLLKGTLVGCQDCHL